MRTISLPFRFDGYGNIASTTDIRRIWADRVRGVVATSLGERLMRPSFGTPTPVHLFRNTDGIESVLDVDIAAAFAKWLPGLTYQGLEFDDAGSEVIVEVLYSIPETAQSEPDSVSVIVEVS